MDTPVSQNPAPASPLEHGLRPHFAELARFHSTKALESSPLYARLREEVGRVLDGVEVGDYTRAGVASASPESGAVRATAWNIERGTHMDEIVRLLEGHEVMCRSDVLLLTELDYGMARSGNRHVAREMAERLGMAYAFAPCYVNLSKGSGLESGAAGENEEALHGNAVLSRWPVRRAWSVALPNGKDKMRGREKRLGSQRAVVCEVEHPAAGRFRAVSLHLDAHSSQRHRHLQMKVVLDFLERLEPVLPVLVGGDWNTSTYNSRRAAYSIAGFFRRVLMGVGHVIENHYLKPERWFERGLFGELSRRGYAYAPLNEPGAGTLHYDVRDLAANTNMGEWVPRWCFWWIEWALRDHGGRCSLKLDWFAGRGIEPDPCEPPRVVGGLRGARGQVLSDHDPIVLDFTVRPEAG